MIPVLILIRPLDLYTGQRVNIRLGSAGDAAALGLGDLSWEPALARRPRIAQDLMSRELDGRFKLAAADFVISMSMLARTRDVNGLHFPGASVVIYRASELSMPQATVEFAGIVSTAPLDLNSRRLTINATVDRSRIDKPLLTREFGGGGGADGEAAVRGVLKPFGAGYNESIEWVLFDTVNNVGMLDGYGNLRTVHRALEGLNDLGPPVADYPNYAALVAALRDKTVVPGRWATCIAEGMVGLGAPPVGRITFVATFALNRTGAIMSRALRVHAGVDDASIDLGAFDLLDVSVNREVRYHTAAQIQVSDLIEAMALPVNATPLITAQNRIAITRTTLSSPVATLRRGGTKPAVTDWRTADPVEPVYRMVFRVARPGVVLSPDEVNYADDLIDRGIYSPTEVYRAGNLVWLADKSQWLYQNSTPAAGHAPPSAKAPDANGDVYDDWWFRRQRSSTAVNLTYANGETIESLKPRQANADITEQNTADAIKGQGPGATALERDIFNGYVTIGVDGRLIGAGGGQVTYGGLGGGALGLLANLFFGSPYLLEQAGGAIAALNAFKTILGQADSIRAQGALATLSALANGGPYLTGFNALSALDRIIIGTSGPGGIVDAGNTRWLGNTDLITSQGSADSFRGQTAWATLNITTARISKLQDDGNARLGAGNFLLSEGADYWVTNANAITSLGTADSIRGQTAFATLPSGTSLDNGIFGMPNRLQGSAQHGSGYLSAAVVAYVEGSTAQALRPQEPGANVTENRTADSIRAQGAFATISSLSYGNPMLTGFNILATLSQISLSTQYIRRADGTTIVTDTLVVTELGYAEGIRGQGTGATANNLADLDKPAADKLAGLQPGGGGSQTVGLGITVTKALAPGASASLYVSVFLEGDGGGSGTVYARIYGGPAGQITLLATGPGGYTANGEPGGDKVGFTFTNNTSTTQAFTFYGDYSGGSGGNVRERLSYFTVS